MKRKILVCLLVGLLSLALAPIPQVQSQMETASKEAEKKTYTHVVVKGDTLWDICESLYGDPWVWPKVWQLNQHITNPHWIYPGDQIRLHLDISGFDFETLAPA